MKKVWKKIGYADKKKEMGSITSPQVPLTWPESDIDIDSVIHLDNPKEAEHWKTVEMPEEIATYLKLRKRLHFGQAHGTPFTVPPLLVSFDWAANSITSELVLEGKYSNTELTYLQQKLLEHCKKEHNSNIMGDKVEIYKWKDKIRNWKERTTMSPWVNT